MGFAGQLFAARVAIGLAIPSPQALSKAGQQLAKGIGGMMTQIQLARKRGTLSSGLQSEFNAISQTAKTSLDKINNEIYIRVKRNMESLNKVTSGGVAANYDRLSNSMQKLKRAMGSDKASTAIFGGGLAHKMHGAGGGMAGAGQLLQNIQKGGATHMQQVLQGQQRYVSALQEEMNIIRKRRAETKLEGEAKATFEKQQDRKLTKLHEEIQLQKELTTYLNQQTGALETEGAQVDDINSKWQGYAEKGLEKAQEAKNKMNESIRTSISLLTVLGYKLNQSAQELVEFERELLNANSVFNLTNDNLYEVGNTITEFGNRFGIAVQNGATGLYQLASAGVSATEALSILPETLKLSMAVQGDHNTISKLTAQTLFGFGMEMNQAAEVTDKFAYAIQKSLIEYQDLSSAVKFALPFFTSTGQSIDQLLGALQILTNRALEAGIAGRGLRQALAEFAESAMDAEAGFRKMGVEILNANGEMMQLTEIAAQFASAVGPETASNTELLTTLIEELNVRGATAFIHLVQASDEFTQAVEDTTNAGGQLDQMVKIQNESLGAQIQIIKNNIFSIFGLRDATYEGTEYINQFHEALINSVQSFKDLIIVEEQGKQKLTEFGMKLQTFATDSLVLIVDLLHEFVLGMAALSESGFDLGKTMKTLTIPLGVIVRAFETFPNLMKFVIWWKTWNTILPMTTTLIWGLNAALAVMMKLMYGGSARKMFAGLMMGGGGGSFGAFTGLGGAGGTAIIPGLGGGAAAAKNAKVAKDSLAYRQGLGATSGVEKYGKNWVGDIKKGTSTMLYGDKLEHAVTREGWYDKHQKMKFFKDKKAISASRQALAKEAAKQAAKKGAGRGLGRLLMGSSKLARFVPGWGTILSMILMGGGLAMGASMMQGGGYIKPRGHGGITGAGSPYLVGEQGPELFVPSQGGQVLNTASTSNIGSNMQFRNVTIGIDSFGGLA